MRTQVRQYRTTFTTATSLMAGAALLAGCVGSNKSTGPNAGSTIQPTTETPQYPTTAPAQIPGGDDVLARIGDTVVTRQQLNDPLFRAFGFDMLMLLVQRNIAHDACRAQGLVVTPEDIKREEEAAVAYLRSNTPGLEQEDTQKLIEQLLAQPKRPGEVSTRVEWDIVMETNAHLRKLAEPLLKDALTDEAVQQEFDERYGASIQVRHLVVANPQEAAMIKAKLAEGKDFVELIRTYSRNPDKHEGGLLPPFTMKSQRYGEAFKRVAFSLKDGEVSDPVAFEGSYHLLRVERRMAPKAIKFEDMRDTIREELQEKIIIQAQKKLRNDFAQAALAKVQITDPTLQEEFKKRMAARDQLIRDRQKIKEEMEKQRQLTPSLSPSATQPAAASATQPAATPPAAAAAPAGATTQTTPATRPATQP